MLKILKGRKSSAHYPHAVVGEVVVADKEGYVRVKTQDASYDILLLQLEGKKQMDGYALSLGRSIAVGDLLKSIKD